MSVDAICLFASARRNGNTGRFMDRIAAELEIEVIDLASKRLAPYTYEHSHRADDFEPLMQRVLGFGQIIFASPVYWYAVSPPMKIFLDRISDYLDLPELLDEGRRLRGKAGWVVCTSIYDEVPASFLGSFRDTFDYLGMHYGGVGHVNCRDGYDPEKHDGEARRFGQMVRNRG